MDYPGGWASPVIISSMSRFSLEAAHTLLDAPAGPATFAPGANVQLLMPFTLPGPYVIRSFWAANGSTAAGNIDIGIYAPNVTSTTLNRLCSTGSTAQSGTSTLQIITPSGGDYRLDRGTYYMAIVNSSTGTFLGRTCTSAHAAVAGTLTAGSAAFPLGSTTTQAANSSTKQPWFGISRIASGY